MKHSLLDILCCPVCKGDLEVTIDAEEKEEIQEGELFCAKCCTRYPIHDGIPDLLPRVPESGTEA
jgi:uncharacterized protein YbaR (Trm112 family)